MASYFIFDPPYLRRHRMQVDYWGLALLTLGLGALQVVLDKGQQEDWFSSSLIISCSLVSVLALLLLVYIELKHEHPIINLRLFRNVSFSAGNFVMFMVGFCLYSSVMLIPLFLQTLMGYDATLAGMVLAPGGVATLITMPFVGAFIQRSDGRRVVLTGLLIGAFAMFLMQRFSLEASYWDFVWPRVILGVGLAMIFVPLTTVTLSTISREEMGNATGIFNLLRNVGGSVGIAIAATMLSRYSQFYQNTLVGHVNPYSFQTQARLSALKQAAIARGFDPVSADRFSLAAIHGMVRRQAGMLAYNRIFCVVGLAFLVIIPLLLLLKKPRHMEGSAGMH
jgi:DHA2 family multidrug resistance protein